MAVEIITLDPDRWEEYRELRLEALRTVPQAFGSSYEEKKDEAEEASRQKLTREFYDYFFAETNGELVGMVLIKFRSTQKLRHIAELFSMYVKQTARKQGVAKQLMRHAIAHCRSHPHVEKIRLDVVTMQEAARDLYHRFGFREVGRLRNEIQFNGARYDTIIMEKHF